ncbi:phage baseplate assembly protein V [uncultured Rhodospira sp.]|uniref:phage baseplate assembly protein V n=1 Tax=uncultured Rhodospira sp. TaxID=1936189 RepID=UPI0026180A79|nr:phage baseplate assembly protein V [uncultured Rhodospira sp.]
MTELVDILREIVRDELANIRVAELAVVTDVYPAGGAGNHQVSVQLLASGTALPYVPVAVPRLGFSMLPRVDDRVVVVFIGGDRNRPIVVGSVYDSDRNPPPAEKLDTAFVPPDDPDDAVKRFHIETPGGGSVTIGDQGTTIEAGGTKVEVQQDGDIVIEAAGSITIKAAAGIEVSSDAALTLQAATDLTLKGLKVAVEGQTETSVKGTLLTLAGTTSFKMA